ncbi:hypothetical protein MAM1_0043c03021 [Mucor ambiguus]|uniref:Uncharacterized protein n=1 Tax=Mucor ambiguus TaxID=91626 RepID=A0A0C9M3I6_9FUNG|nr:hypothetical protein MAM1_0043c03021 [Mucor ambiguus]
MYLKDQLEANKSHIIKLLDNPPKSKEHRSVVQSGKTTVNGREYRVNDDFVKEALFLSDQLDMDEFEASRFLLEGISKAPAMNAANLDAAVYLYHEERGYILTILIVLLEATKDDTVDTQLTSVFYSFMADIVADSTTSFVQKILNTEKDLTAMINSLSKTGMLASTATAMAANASANKPPQPATSSLFQQPQQQQQQQQQQQPQNELKFDRQTTSMRIDKLIDERVYLVEILYHISSLFWLNEPDLLALISKAQSANLSDATCSYITVALLSALSIQRKQPAKQSFTTSNAYLKNIHQHMTTKPWKVNTLKATVEVRWALTLSEISATQPSVVENTLSMNKASRVTFVESALALDVFGFLNDYLLYFKQNLTDAADKKSTIGLDDMEVDSSHAMAMDGLIVDPNDYTKFVADTALDFQKFVIEELELLTESFIFNMSDIFSNLKKMTSSQQADATTSSEEVAFAHSLQKFLTLMASIFRDRLNAGLKFWDHTNVLSTFLPWILEFKTTQDLAAIFDFLGSISTGEQCAPLAHTFLKMGIAEGDVLASHLFSWGKLFSALQFYAKLYTERSTSEEEPPTMPLEEEITLCKFLYVCQQVVQYSDQARSDIWSNPVLKAHESIVAMISCPTSTRFRAALYDLLSAFCSNWGGGINHVGESISLQVWHTLEYSDMILPEKTMATMAPVETATCSKAAPSASAPVSDGATAAQKLQAQDIISKAAAATAGNNSSKPARPTPTYYLPEQPAGFMREYSDEKNRRLYTETMSVLKLFSSLIHTESKRDQLVSGFVPTANSIPFCLGHDNHRSPGTAPYVSLVIDHILLNLKHQQYMYPETKWQLTDACLKIVENSILAFNIQPLCDYIYYASKDAPESTPSYTALLEGTANTTTSAGKKPSADLQHALLACVSHPGFDILIRILSGGSLIQEMFQIVEKGKDAFSSDCKTKCGSKNMHFKNAMARCLRIFSKVFGVQNVFVNVLMPQLKQDAQDLPMGQFKLGPYTFPSPPAELRSLANHMLYNTQVIVQIALMVNCEDYQDICRLSTSVLESLASAPEDDSVYIKFPHHVNVPIGGLGSRLAGILLSSDSANEIIFGFGERLEIDTAEITTYDDYEYDFNAIPFWLAEKTMSNVYRYERDEEECYSYTASVRIGILDILLKSMGKEVPSPTIAEFLLGYDVQDPTIKSIQQSSLVTDKRARLACLLSILSMVKTGMETDKDDDDQDTEQPTLIQTHPVLAEKCYQLIYKLCARESTSRITLQYLCGGDDFMLKQFQAITCRLENCVSVVEPNFAGELISADQTRVKTDYLTLVSVLNQRAWLLKLIALDLHQLAGTPLKSESTQLLNLMYGISTDQDSSTLADKLKSMQLASAGTDHGYQQPLWNLVEIINSLDFTWIDQLDDAAAAQKGDTYTYFAGFNAKKHLVKKLGEYEVYDIRNIYKTLRQYQLTDPSVKCLSDVERTKMESEMGAILKQLMAENRHRDISYGRLHCLRAWKQVVEITISDCFESFTFEARERIIYDLLNVLLPKLESDTGLHVDILKGLSQVVLSLLTRLREDKRRQAILQVTPPMFTTSSGAKLPEDKLRNVFAMIINCICKEKTSLGVRSTMYSALVNLLQYIAPDDGDASNCNDSLQELFRTQMVQLFKDDSDKSLLSIMCKDAREGFDDYKATAYAALEAIYVLLNDEGRLEMLRLLVRSAFLKYAIEAIESSNETLLYIVEDRDAPLIPLNIHEAKISFFMQIALNKEGASLLVNNGLLQTLNNCTFMAVRPDNDNNPNALKRYRRLLIPILELVNVMLKDKMNHFMAYDMLKFEEWVKKQGILLHILKDQNKHTTLSTLYILQLTTSLVFQLSCQRDYFVSLEERGLDAIDHAMMNLITKYCLSRNWASVVVPTNEEEEKWATEKVPATVNNHEMESMLVAKADKYIVDIINNLLSYAETSTFRIVKKQAGESFKPVFANTLDSIKDRAPNSLRKASSTTPSLTTLVACISFTDKKLTTVIAEFESLCSQKNNVGSLKYEEILELTQTAIPKRLGIQYDSLNPTQKTQLLTTEIAHRCKLKAKEMNDLLFTIENAIYILWRHLEYYMRTESIMRVQHFSPCDRSSDANENVVLLQQALFQTSTSVISTLKAACQTVLEPVLQKLEKIPNVYQNDTNLSQMYKRIRKCYN